MPEKINNCCETCSERREDCCKSCFTSGKGKQNIFDHLSVEQMESLLDKKQRIKYKPGETIIKQNTAATFVICIKEGLAKAFVEGHKEKNLILRVVGPGAFVTGGGLFNGNIQHYTISAITPVTCCLIDSAKLTQLFSENVDFAIALMRYHTMRNNRLLTQMVNLTQKYMPGRVADTLLYLKDEVFGENPFNSILTRQELADMSNMTKESFVRILQQFKESGVIHTQGNTILIKNEDELRSISQNG